MRILIIEDNESLMRNLEKGLKKEGYFVDTASTSRMAEYKLANWIYDAIILDVILPDTDGYTLLEYHRSRNDATPVLMLTALSGPANRVKGLDLGADDYLEKPFSFSELLARLRALIRRSSGDSQSLITMGHVTLDMNNRAVEKAGELINLTRQEFAVISALAQRRGKLVSREFLLDRLYDTEDTAEQNLLDVLIYNLRKKLGHDVINTRRGHGYMIVE